MVNNFVIDYDFSEFGDKLKMLDFPKETIYNDILKRLIFMTPDEARDEILYNHLLLDITGFTKPYSLEAEGLEMVDEKIVLFLKVKDTDGMNVPKLIPWNGAWFLIGTGPHSEMFDIEMCFNMEEYSYAYRKLFGNEHSFAYFCTLDQDLEVIDWHTFYDYNDENNRELVNDVRTRILHEYKKYMKQVSAFGYRCITK